ncbi:hypothetical protein ABEB36_005438 [Hypothenemus hampei]|uniref:Fidgetin-like protein 1 n=1 Tax=Hypothenemus hampei TaxID=57062 RepID=A0ABD1F0V6_HYPHA
MNKSFHSSNVDLPQTEEQYQNDYKTLNIQRRFTIQSFQLASKCLDNLNSCDLLTHSLEKYSDAICRNGQNIYYEELIKKYPNINSKRQFKIRKELPKLDLCGFLDDLECTKDKKLICPTSERISKHELKQFENIFTEKKEKNLPLRTKLTLEERFANLDKLQKIHDSTTLPSFSTARDELENQVPNQRGLFGDRQSYSEECISHESKKTLGLRRNVRSKFVSPLLSNKSSSDIEENIKQRPVVDQRLKNIEPKMVELIMAEIMDKSPNITWTDIAGLEFAKTAIHEAIVWPLLRPDIFTGLRKPPKGILLFGPPGTGKTLIGKCVASQSKSTFFSISASSLTSKWIGEGEKMVRALFQVARVHQPSVIFIDEVDSLLTQRNETEHESTRRIKTEFLVQLDGATTDNEERLLVIGATNRPQELDEAARRRFVKRLYIPLPEYQARIDLLKQLMANEKHSLNENQFCEIAKLSQGYSGADIKNLCSEAALEPIRSIDLNNIQNIQASQVRSLTMEDFEKSLKRVRPSVASKDLHQYITWDETYGSGGSL